MKKFLYSLIFTFLLSSLFTGVALAQDSTPPTDDEVNAVAHQLYCPVCESTPLDVCPTDACKDWREQIRVMLSEGKSEDEILQYFEDQYGARVLAEPPKQGFYWLIYLLPSSLPARSSSSAHSKSGQSPKPHQQARARCEANRHALTRQKMIMWRVSKKS